MIVILQQKILPSTSSRVSREPWKKNEITCLATTPRVLIKMRKILIEWFDLDRINDNGLWGDEKLLGEVFWLEHGIEFKLFDFWDHL